MVRLSAASATRWFSRATGVSALIAAVQRRIDEKPARDQWGDVLIALNLGSAIALRPGHSAASVISKRNLILESSQFGSVSPTKLDKIENLRVEVQVGHLAPRQDPSCNVRLLFAKATELEVKMRVGTSQLKLTNARPYDVIHAACEQGELIVRFFKEGSID